MHLMAYQAIWLIQPIFHGFLVGDRWLLRIIRTKARNNFAKRSTPFYLMELTDFPLQYSKILFDATNYSIFTATFKLNVCLLIWNVFKLIQIKQGLTLRNSRRRTFSVEFKYQVLESLSTEECKNQVSIPQSFFNAVTVIESREVSK